MVTAERLSGVSVPPRDRAAAVDARRMMESAEDAAAFLKALANPDRLVILCQLVEGEKTVTELGGLLKLRQPTLSQQLARLRADALVRTRRNGKHIYYALASPEATRVIELLDAMFCAPADGGAGRRRWRRAAGAEADGEG